MGVQNVSRKTVFLDSENFITAYERKINKAEAVIININNISKQTQFSVIAEAAVLSPLGDFIIVRCNIIFIFSVFIVLKENLFDVFSFSAHRIIQCFSLEMKRRNVYCKKILNTANG